MKPFRDAVQILDNFPCQGLSFRGEGGVSGSVLVPSSVENLGLIFCLNLQTEKQTPQRQCL